MAQPVDARRAAGRRPYASVGFWPARGAHGQFYVRLSHIKRAGSAVLLRIDGRSFQLAGGGANAWAPNRQADAAIVSAMRSGVNMAVETRNERGARVRDHYLLRGAASAVDAAAIACART